ncbi:MAG: DUF2061 domain-containing protein [Candidatus Omnitrophica bacterium]|nr:DUF2061 domain-containing protein [Candidatus Omnitrophota bacterium]
MEEYKDAHWRSLFKALSWRILATASTILIVYTFTHKLVLSLEVGAVEVVVKLILYYVHERAWLSVPLGSKIHPLSSLPVKDAIKEEDMEKIKIKLKELGYLDEI